MQRFSKYFSQKMYLESERQFTSLKVYTYTTTFMDNFLNNFLAEQIKSVFIKGANFDNTPIPDDGKEIFA